MSWRTARLSGFSLRTWLLLALLTIVVLPLLAQGATTILVRSPDLSNPVVHQLVADHPFWNDPDWRLETRRSLESKGVEVLLLDPAGTEVLRTGGTKANQGVLPPPVNTLAIALPWYADAPLGTPSDQLRGFQRLVLMTEDPVIGVSTVAGILYLVVPLEAPNWWRLWLPPLAGVAAILLALTFIWWFVGRAISAPLAAVSEAAERIGAGESIDQIPGSPVREVAALTSQFAAMASRLQASLQQQVALEQERRFFLSAIVHDLRTPLFALNGYLEGLEQGLAATPERAARYIAVCREKATSLERLIADLFAYAQVEWLEQQLRQEKVNLDALLRRIVEARQPQAATKGVRLAVTTPPQPVAICADELLLTRAVENLLDNALRHTPQGGDVTIAWQRRDADVCFSVTDSGPGFTPQELPQLFRPFYRGEPSRNRRTAGAGLGLAIAQRILIAHGGELVAANRLTGGAQVTGRLARWEGGSGGGGWIGSMSASTQSAQREREFAELV